MQTIGPILSPPASPGVAHPTTQAGFPWPNDRFTPQPAPAAIVMPPLPPQPRASSPPTVFWQHAARCGLLAAGQAIGGSIGAALDGPARVALVQMVDDMRADGIRFYRGEERGGGGSYSRLERDEIVDVLLRSRADALDRSLCIQANEMDEWHYPRTLDDLRAMDGIVRTGDVAGCAAPDLARDLHALRDVRFEVGGNAFHRSLGAVGAYVALSEARPGDAHPDMRDGSPAREPLHTVYGDVSSRADVRALAYFETGAPDLHDPLAGLERDGTTFHQAASKRPLTAYEVWRERPADLRAGICGVDPVAGDPAAAHVELRAMYAALRKDSVPRDERETIVRSLVGRDDAAPRFARLSRLRAAEAPWGREQGTPAQRALAVDAAVETGELCGLLKTLPQADALSLMAWRRAHGEDDTARLTLLLGHHAVAREAAGLDAGAGRLLAPAIALEQSLTPAGPPVQRQQDMAQQALDDVRLAVSQRLPGQPLQEAFDILADVHRALSRNLSWKARAEVFRFALDEIDHGKLRGRNPRETVQELVAAFVLSGDVERARDHVLEQAGDGGRVERSGDTVVIGGIRVPRRAG